MQTKRNQKIRTIPRNSWNNLWIFHGWTVIKPHVQIRAGICSVYICLNFKFPNLPIPTWWSVPLSKWVQNPGYKWAKRLRIGISAWPLRTVNQAIYINWHQLSSTNSIQFHPIPSNSIQFHPIPSNSIQFHPISIQFHPISIQFHPIPSNSIQFHPIPSNSIQFHPIPSNSIQFHPIYKPLELSTVTRVNHPMSSNSHQTRERLTAMALQLLDEFLLRLTGRFQPGNGRVQLGLAAPLVDAWGF